MNSERYLEHLKKLFSSVGEDPEREGLQKTPQRYLESFKELTSGYSENLTDVLNGALFDDENYNDMILIRNIEFYSLCEHHILPFYGYCHVGYIPNKKIIGLSKIPRIVDIFAKRLQVRERLTNQIADTLSDVLDPQGLGVIIEGSHFCMAMRGVKKQNSFVTTNCMKGCFTDSVIKTEFLNRLQTKPIHNGG